MSRTLVLPLVLLASCGTMTAVRGPSLSLNVPPAESQMAAADFGPAPRADHQSQIRATISQRLRNPESARYRFAEPEASWMPRYHFDQNVEGEPFQHGHVFGWRVIFAFNAKNDFGGYGGEMGYIAFFRDGQLRGVFQVSPREDIFGYENWFRVL